jgi:hypothetical protein
MKKLLIIPLLLISLLANAQESIGIFQDAKFLVLGDPDHNIDPLTIATTIYFKMYGNEQRLGKMYILVKANYTDLNPKYIRYGAEGGYQFDFNKWEASVGIGIGSINRFEASTMSFQGVLGVWYRITPKIKLGALNKLTQRSDLSYWNDSGFRYEFDFGIEIEL